MRRLLDEASPMPRRRGSTAKTILIVLGILGGVAFLSCLGIGVAGYFYVKKTFGEIAVTDEPGIRKIVGEMADITVPPEFAPQMASSVFGIRNVFFKWCPDKNCPPLSLDANNADADGPDAEQPGTLERIPPSSSAKLGWLVDWRHPGGGCHASVFERVSSRGARGV